MNELAKVKMFNFNVKKMICVNNILKKSNSARARQVFESEICFQEILKETFGAITADSYFLTRIFKKENNIFRKLFFHFFFLARFIFIFKSRKTIVYSRNLSILVIAKILGFNIVWEAHDLPLEKNIIILKKLLIIVEL